MVDGNGFDFMVVVGKFSILGSMAVFIIRLIVF